MSKCYVYKNVRKAPVNIGGYQFNDGQELESDVLINGFSGAVSNGFLELTERNPETTQQDMPQVLQTGDTVKVKVIFHIRAGVEGKEILKEIEVDPDISVEFPNIDLRKDETFKGWFKDAEFIKSVNVDKAKSPKKGERHFYGKYEILKKEDTLPVNPNPNDSVGST
jgi:hypothetical protein